MIGGKPKSSQIFQKQKCQKSCKNPVNIEFIVLFHTLPLLSWNFLRSLSDMGVIVIGSRLAAKMPKKNFLNFFESLSKEKSVERLSFRSSGNQTRYLGGQIEKGKILTEH